MRATMVNMDQSLLLFYHTTSPNVNARFSKLTLGGPILNEEKNNHFLTRDLPLFSLLFKIEPPLAEHIFGMRIRRGEKTLNSNAIVYDLSEACKFPTVHFLAYKLA